MIQERLESSCPVVKIAVKLTELAHYLLFGKSGSFVRIKLSGKRDQVAVAVEKSKSQVTT